MLKLFKRDKTTPIDENITDVLTEMKTVGVDDEGYPKLMTLLERLYEIKAKQSRSPVSSDTLATIVGSFLNILLIVAYEQKHVMTSMGFRHIIKPKN